MEEVEYLHWEDYYQNTWINDYKKIQAVRNDASLSPLERHKAIAVFFKSTIFLLLTYLRNHGHFYNKNTMVIRVAFRSGVLREGESLIFMNDMLTVDKKYKREEIIKYVLYDHFSIFEEIDQKMKEFLEQK